MPMPMPMLREQRRQGSMDPSKGFVPLGKASSPASPVSFMQASEILDQSGAEPEGGSHRPCPAEGAEESRKGEQGELVYYWRCGCDIGQGRRNSCFGGQGARQHHRRCRAQAQLGGAGRGGRWRSWRGSRVGAIAVVDHVGARHAGTRHPLGRRRSGRPSV